MSVSFCAMFVWWRRRYSRANLPTGASAGPGATTNCQSRSQPRVTASPDAVTWCPLSIWRNIVSEMMLMLAPFAFSSSALMYFAPFWPCPKNGEPESPTTR